MKKGTVTWQGLEGLQGCCLPGGAEVTNSGERQGAVQEGLPPPCCVCAKERVLLSAISCHSLCQMSSIVSAARPALFCVAQQHFCLQRNQRDQNAIAVMNSS